MGKQRHAVKEPPKIFLKFFLNSPLSPFIIRFFRIVMRPGDDAPIEIFIGHILLGDNFSAHGNSGEVDAFLFTGNERMPPGQVLPVADEPVSAGFGHPVKLGQILRRQRHAGRHPDGAVGIIRAGAGFAVKKRADDIGVENFGRVLVFQLHEAAFGAAIAEGFPLRPRHFLQPLPFPEGLWGFFLFAGFRHGPRLLPKNAGMAVA